MKRFVPIKYIFGMIALFFLLPLFLAFFITLVFGFNHYTITVTIFLVAVVISGPFVPLCTNRPMLLTQMHLSLAPSQRTRRCCLNTFSTSKFLLSRLL